MVAQRDGDASWIISNNWLEYELGLGGDGVLRARRFTQQGQSFDWVDHPPPDTTLLADGEVLELGRSDQLTMLDARTEEYGPGLRLAMTFEAADIAIEKSLVCYPDVAVLEQWLTIWSRQGERSTRIDSPGLLAWSSPATRLEWLRGLDQPAELGGSFTIEHREVFPDDRVELRAFERSTESAWPWAVLRTGTQAMFTGVLWSGAWALDVEGWERGTRVRAGLPSFSTTVAPDRPFESPHIFLGLSGAESSSVGRVMRRFVDVAVRDGRPLWPLTTYNTWFSHGIHIDEDSTTAEIERAADLGIELFELDAGWYPRPTNASAFDFTAGLGSWVVDADRFPNGIRRLGERARSLGMKFGLWVEPERIDLATLGHPGGAEEAWLARSNGRTEPSSGDSDPRGALLCLAHPGARAWVLDRVSELVEREALDYLKWDNNAWLNCDREGHGHGPHDGNYAHVRGLYDVLRELRRRFPSLLVENVSGGGHRIDLEMLRYTDAGWMDDRTAPSTHVRHNLEGLSRAVPLAYLLSYTMAHATEPLHDAADMRWLVGSRMPGVLGFSYRSSDLSESDTHALSGEIALYKRLRETLADAHAALLTPQVPVHGGEPWDVLEAVSPSTGRALLFIYRNSRDAAPIRARLEGLDPEAAYTVESADRGVIGTFPGAYLIDVGLELTPSGSSSAAQTFLLTPVGR